MYVSYSCTCVAIAIKVMLYIYVDNDDVLFMDTNFTDFTLSVGTRICFDVMIIDDTEIESNEYYGFDVMLQNGTYIYDYTDIIIIDNDGEC